MRVAKFVSSYNFIECKWFMFTVVSEDAINVRLDELIEKQKQGMLTDIDIAEIQDEYDKAIDIIIERSYYSKPADYHII